jgi:glycerophosphoryl diester phosphodiesterase
MFKNHILIAHRGYSAKYPENTILAFEKAIGKFDMIEFDISYTKDNKFIVIHDDTLIRTSNAAKYNMINKVWEYEYSELKKLNVGKDQKIPLLDEALKFSSQIELNIEIKHIKDDLLYYLSDLIDKFTTNIIVSSFEHNILLSLKRINKKINTALLIDQKKDISYLKTLKSKYVNISDSIATKDYIKYLQKDFLINVYTVNKYKRIQELYNYGVYGVFSNYTIEDLKERDV